MRQRSLRAMPESLALLTKVQRVLGKGSAASALAIIQREFMRVEFESEELADI
jgi:hypothetical protein